MIVDVQQHYVPPSLLQAYRAAGTGHGEREDVTNLELRLPEMDAAAVDYALLSVPVLDRYDHDRATTVALVARHNDGLLQAAERHPERFGALIALPFPFSPDCLTELARLEGHPLVKGVILFATTNRWTLDQPRFEPVLEAIADAHLPAMVHPAEEDLLANPLYDDWALRNWIPPMIETSTVVARLMLSGVLDRVPTLTLIVPHLGGVLPYLAQRAIDQSGTGSADHDVLHYLRTRCLLDSCSYHPPALACALATVGASRILMGTDYPFRGALVRATEDIASAPLTDAERTDVLGGTARRHGRSPAGRVHLEAPRV